MEFSVFTEGEINNGLRGRNDFLMDRILLQPGYHPSAPLKLMLGRKADPIKEKVLRAKLQTHKQLKIEYFSFTLNPPSNNHIAFFPFL